MEARDRVHKIFAENKVLEKKRQEKKEEETHRDLQMMKEYTARLAKVWGPVVQGDDGMDRQLHR